MVPSTWEMEALLDLAHFQNGKAFRSDDWQSCGLPLIRIPQMDDPRAVEHFVEPDSVEPRFRVEPGDLLFSWSGSLKVSRWRGPEAALNQHIFNVRPADGIHATFLEYLISRSIEMLESRAHGTTMRHITKRMMSGLDLPIPPLPEQKKIAAILSSVDDAIAATREVIEQTKRMKKGLLQDLMTRGIGHTRFKKTKIGQIPEEWEVVTLHEVTTGKGSYGANASKTQFSPDLPRYLRITDISDGGSLNNDDPVSIAESDAEGNLVKKDDFLFARTGATVGKTYRVTGKEGRAAYAGYLIKFRPNSSRLHPVFLEAYTHSPRYWSWVEDTARTTAQPNINATEYGSMPLPLPPLEEQTRIADLMRQIDRTRATYEHSGERLKQLKRGLMQDLLTGRVRVPVD